VREWVSGRVGDGKRGRWRQGELGTRGDGKRRNGGQGEMAIKIKGFDTIKLSLFPLHPISRSLTPKIKIKSKIPP